MCNTPSLNNSNKILSKQRLCMKRQFLGVQEGVWAWQQLGRRRRESRGPERVRPHRAPGCAQGAGPQAPGLCRHAPSPVTSATYNVARTPGSPPEDLLCAEPWSWLCLDGLSGATQQAWEMRLSPVHKSQDRGLSARKQQSRPKHSRLASGPPRRKRAPLHTVRQPGSPRPL